MSAAPWKKYEGKKPDDEPELRDTTMPEVEIVAQRPLENKTELNADGTPKQTVEAKPEDFTVGESELGVMPSEPAEPAADAVGTTAAPEAAITDGNKAKVEPLNVKPITPAISGGLDETEQQRQERMAKRNQEAARIKYEEEHPWVLEDDYSNMRNKYKDKKWSQIVSDVAAYREKIGKPMNQVEMANMLMQYNPNTSKKEEVREKRLAYWADALNQIGNVLAHIYNYGRAKGGSPAAQIPGNKTSYSERLKAADMAMRQRGYNDYVNAMTMEQKRKADLADNITKLKQKAEFETWAKKYQLDNDPEMKKKYELLCEQGETQKAKTIAAKYDADKKRVEALDLPKENIRKQEEHDINMALKQSQINKNNRSGGKSSGGGGKGSWVYNGKHFTSDYAAYSYACGKKGINPETQAVYKANREELNRKVGVTLE